MRFSANEKLIELVSHIKLLNALNEYTISLHFHLITVSSLNNSHSGSVELNESKTVSVDFDKTNSISSDEGSYNLHKAHSSASNRKLRQASSNSLTVQSFSTHLNQSMPNLTSGPYHINSNNTLLVPGATKSHSAHSSHSGNLLSPSQRGISYPPPSPTRYVH